jgi:broad specificity phosphatase PhoE
MRATSSSVGGVEDTMLVYAVRHAESLANTGESASLNSGLTALGGQQVEALKRRFAAPPPVAIYSSPYRRCLQTALPIARAAGVPVRLRRELCEYHHFEPGTPADTELSDLATICREHPGVIGCPDYPGDVCWPPADEPFDSVLDRTRSFAGYLKNRWTGALDTILLLSHGSPIARLIEAWLTDQPGPWFRFTIDNASVAALRYYEGVSSLICLNELSHLGHLPPPARANFRTDGSIKAMPPNGYW